MHRMIRVPTLLLRTVIPSHEIDRILDDLEEELIEIELPGRSRTGARLWLYRETLSLLTSYLRSRIIQRDTRDLSVVLQARRQRRRCYASRSAL